MTALSVAPTDDAIMTALRAFLIAILPPSVEVIQGQDNRVAEPKVPDFIVMTPMNQVRMATNEDEWSTAIFPPATPPSELLLTASVMMAVQLDVHGPNAPNNTLLLSTVWRDEFATDNVDTSIIAPLYTDDPVQMPFINGEAQYENRWVIMLYLQVRPQVVTPMQFADIVNVTLVEVA